MLTPSARGSAGLYGRAAPAACHCRLRTRSPPSCSCLGRQSSPTDLVRASHRAAWQPQEPPSCAPRSPGLTRHTLVLGSLTSGLLCLSKPTLYGDDPPPSLHGHYPASTLLRGSPPLSGASVLSASRLEPLAPCMGLSESSRDLSSPPLSSFVPSLCSTGAIIPSSRPGSPTSARRSRQSWPSHTNLAACSAFANHTLTASSPTARLVRSDFSLPWARWSWLRH